MRTATRKHLTLVRGTAKFAQVTVGRIDLLNADSLPPDPQIILNDRAVDSLSEFDREIIEAAQRGIRETETGLCWQGPKHFVVKIEGLRVDGIDLEAARLAASEAAKELIQS